jgi:chemotaxis protein histidine kinase CheA
MAKKAKAKAAKKATKAKSAKKPAAKKPAASKAKPASASAPSATPAPKPLKPLTMKQRLALIRVDPTTGRCPHNLIPETCSFCMSI